MPANHPVSFSLFLPQAAQTYQQLRQTALRLEALGYDGLWLVDHMWAEGIPELDFLDGWTAVAGIAEATESLRLGLLVACNSYRNPGLLAKMAVSLDHISAGRAELGIGAGWQESEYKGYGIEFPPVGVRLEQLGESLAIIESLFSRERTNLEGRHYRFHDVPFEPKPVQDRLPITIGGAGKKVLLALVARYASRWNCPMPDVARMPELIEALAAHCKNIGRDPSEITISEQMAVVIGRDAGDLAAQMEVAKMFIGGFVDLNTMAVIGTPDQVVAKLEAKMELGVTDFAIVFGDLGSEATLELFATQVMERFRA